MHIQSYQQILLLIFLAINCSTHTALQHFIQRTMRSTTLSSPTKPIHIPPQHTMQFFGTHSSKPNKATDMSVNAKLTFLNKQLPTGTKKHIFMCGKKGALAGCLMGIPAGAYLGFTEALQYRDTPHALSLPGGFLTDITAQTIAHAAACGWVGAFWATVGGSALGIATLPLLHLAHNNRLMPQNNRKQIHIIQDKKD